MGAWAIQPKGVKKNAVEMVSAKARTGKSHCNSIINRSKTKSGMFINIPLFCMR